MTRFAATPAFATRHICRSVSLGSSVVLLVSACQARGPTPADRPPIIDMHLHAHSLSQYGGGMPNCGNDQQIMFPGIDPREPITLGRVKTCASPMAPAATDELLMKESLAMLERHNIFAVTTGPLERVRTWRAMAPLRIMPAHAFGDPESDLPAFFGPVAIGERHRLRGPAFRTTMQVSLRPLRASFERIPEGSDPWPGSIVQRVGGQSNRGA